MKRGYLWDVTVATAFVAGGQVLAEGAETRTMRAMIAGIEFITQNSSLEYGGQTLPDVTVVSENDLHLRFRASDVLLFAEAGDQARGRVAAYYDRYANHIYLSDVESSTGPGLLHELVHFLQKVNGRDDMFVSHPVCLEAEAYDLQASWQTERGIDLLSRPDYGFVMTLYAVCNDADFSWVDSANLSTKR